ncbi:MAG TPA: transketolase C-terminal domain-containing protein [Ignavibacteria bacterium]|nr:transketolase C-terminal domain-containing protein [Ignavibacteria bacterium]
MQYYTETPEMKETRKGFADSLEHIGGENPNVVVLGGDVTGSVRTNQFRDAYPDRFFSVGIAEQDMMGTAAGLALAGKIPIASTYGEFATGRPFDQIRQSIAYSEMNVKICASHAGITVGYDGATHQSFEDVAIMRVLPNMTVLTPCDYNETYNALKAAVDFVGPCYVRFYRENSPNFTDINEPFEIGKMKTMVEGNDLTLMASGLIVWNAIVAAHNLAKEGINVRVVNASTIKPIDKEMILKCADETGMIITCEDHQWTCGLYGAVAEVLAKERPTPMDWIAINDTFGESGAGDQLMVKYNLDHTAIERKVKEYVKK